MSERPARYLSEDEHRRYAPKILQLLPAGGWGAVYPHRDSETNEIGFDWRPLACWALVEVPERPDDARTTPAPMESFPYGGQAVVGFAPGELDEVSSVAADDAFLGYAASERDTILHLEVFLERAELYYRERNRQENARRKDGEAP